MRKLLVFVATMAISLNLLTAQLLAISPYGVDTEIGKHKNVLVPDDERYDDPYIAMVYLEIHWDNNTVNQGTGFAISEHCMLTAAHNIIRYDDDGNVIKAVRYVAYFGGKNSGSGQKVELTTSLCSFWYCPDFESQHNNAQYDYGYITFPYFMTFAFDTFDLAPSESNSVTTNTSVTLTGYIPDKPPAGYSGKGPYLYTVTGEVTNKSGGILYYNMDTLEGQSGSPVYIQKNGRYIALAVHSRGFNTGSTAQNSGWIITQDFVDMLCSKGLYTK